MGQGITLFLMSTRDLPKLMVTADNQPTSDNPNSGIWIPILSL